VGGTGDAVREIAGESGMVATRGMVSLKYLTLAVVGSTAQQIVLKGREVL